MQVKSQSQNNYYFAMHKALHFWLIYIIFHTHTCMDVALWYYILYMHADLTVFIKESNDYLDEVVTEVHTCHSQRYILQISYGQQLNEILVQFKDYW